ncbi:15347_t:CDS:2 [Funneliformis mosseae]|uniref:15347_t:CDS:1 n=1 Tax=Funneliformis mosseae TaxID=27381 RepID=A0A9N9C2N0_FUNMO|nr:15347_t:CDS:2 [Funneliformis mosseae]
MQQIRNEKYTAHLNAYYYYHEYVKKISDEETDIFPRDTPTENPKICIIGAGATGLFSALLLKEAGINDITILEVQDRIGGRIHTHYFTDDPDDERRLYGELGAMRLPYVDGRPDLSPHQIVFDTIDYLNEYNKDDPKKQIRTIPFIFRDSDSISYFNGKKDPSGKFMTKNYSETADVSKLGYPDTIPPNFVKLWNEALKPFFDELNTDYTKGLKALKRYDQYSVYSYLKEVFLPARLPTKWEDYDEIIAAIELQVTGTNEFTKGFVDFAIGTFTFGNPNYPLSWKTIDKGMQRFPNAFLPFIKKEKIDLRYNSEVYKIEKTDDGKNVKVYWNSKGKKEFEIFDRVIVTPPLGVVRHWDLPLTLSYGKKRAIRELKYLNAGKIFLQFKSRFWEKEGQPTTSGAGIVGGTTSTDLPVRTVVYPSYYQGLSTNGSGVLLASYTWDDDATKFSPYSEEERFELALKDLVTLHGEIAYEEWIPGKENNKAHYWSNDKTVVGGAYAKYGPAQLGKLMESMMRSEEFIHWAGEHTDIHNAWIAGALNSAVRVVREILLENLMKDRWLKLKNSRLLKYWNGNLEAFEGY